jgi:hypothetical protein
MVPVTGSRRTKKAEIMRNGLTVKRELTEEEACELVDKFMDLGDPDESAKAITNVVFFLVQGSDARRQNVAMAIARRAYLQTSHFEEAFNQFAGIDSFVAAPETETVAEITTTEQ